VLAADVSGAAVAGPAVAGAVPRAGRGLSIGGKVVI